MGILSLGGLTQDSGHMGWAPSGGWGWGRWGLPVQALTLRRSYFQFLRGDWEEVPLRLRGLLRRCHNR